MPPPYALWIKNKTPNTCTTAKVTSTRNVRNVSVIYLSGANYRSSLPLDGYFELLHANQIPKIKYGSLRIEVICSWFGVKPPHTYPNLEVNPNAFLIIPSYTGLVVDNIGI